MEKVEKAIFKSLKKVVKKERLDKIDDQTLIREDLSISSLVIISLFMSITNELNISITKFADTDLFQVTTIGDLKSLLTQALEDSPKV